MDEAARATSDDLWLEWSKRLMAAAQNGLEYNNDPFNAARYDEIRDIAADMMARYGGLARTEVRRMMDAEVGHATPKIDVRGVVFRDDAILMVREKIDNRWSLPGGWADVYDTPSEATVREIWEESGYRTRAVKLLALLDRTKQGHPPIPFHAYKAFFRCEIEGGSPTVSIETTDVDFFQRHDLPELSVGRVTAAQIERCFEHRDHPDWPADFD